MTNKQQLPKVDIYCEMMKAARGGWATKREIREATDFSEKTVNDWTEGLVRNGMFKTRERTGDGMRGKAPQEFTVSSQWGGLPS